MTSKNRLSEFILVHCTYSGPQKFEAISSLNFYAHISRIWIDVVSLYEKKKKFIHRKSFQISGRGRGSAPYWAGAEGFFYSTVSLFFTKVVWSLHICRILVCHRKLSSHTTVDSQLVCYNCLLMFLLGAFSNNSFFPSSIGYLSIWERHLFCLCSKNMYQRIFCSLSLSQNFESSSVAFVWL